MIKVITVDDVKSLIHKISLERFFECFSEKLISYFKHNKPYDFKIAYDTTSPINQFLGKDYHFFKYQSKTVENISIAIGQLTDAMTGYPIVISEMTLLSTLARTTLLALKCKDLARAKSKTLALIELDSSTEFAVVALKTLLGIERVQLYEPRPNLIKSFEHNLNFYGFTLIPMTTVEKTLQNADIVISDLKLIDGIQMSPNSVIHIPMNNVLSQSTQQTITDNQSGLWEMIGGIIPEHRNNKQIAAYPAQELALADYAVLKYAYSLSEDFHVGHMLDLIPELENSSNLFGFLN